MTQNLNLTGVQACVLSTVFVKNYDNKKGLKTGGYISGYRGSPLAGFDKFCLEKINYLKENKIDFVAGLNRDLALASVAGTQFIEFFGSPKKEVKDGVVGYWYGKGPGLDRSFDVLRHYNFQGTSKNGGVILFCGDDLQCNSSTMPHHSTCSLRSFYVPLLYPNSVYEIFELVLKGVYLSRYSGSFVGIKIVTNLADSYENVNMDLLNEIEIGNLTKNDDVNIKLNKTGIQQEEDIFYKKIPLIEKFILSNSINKLILSDKNKEFGIICIGKNLTELQKIYGNNFPCDVLHIRCSWPIPQETILNFIINKKHILVVEEKRPVVRSFCREVAFLNSVNVNLQGSNLIKRTLYPDAKQIYNALVSIGLEKEINYNTNLNLYNFNIQKRTPQYCGGCPHNVGTKLPNKSFSLLGIGCHYISRFDSKGNQITINPMGSEGSTWVSISRYLRYNNHVFVNLGDGTYFHSGILSIRFAVSNNIPVTFKILFNGVVAMTGGQNIDGNLTPEKIVHQLLAEGVKKQNICVVYKNLKIFDKIKFSLLGIKAYPKSKYEEIQRLFSYVKDVTVIIYVQECATEKSRKIKRGLIKGEKYVLLINSDVCDSCGNCFEKSNNCMALEKVFDGMYLEKTQINRSLCNLDKSCLDGYCPSFIKVNKDYIKNVEDETFEKVVNLVNNYRFSEEIKIDNKNKYKILVMGIGGTGTSTLTKIISDSAYESGFKNIRSLDKTGLSQRFGEVTGEIILYKDELVEDLEFYKYCSVIALDTKVFLSNINNIDFEKAIVNVNFSNYSENVKYNEIFDKIKNNKSIILADIQNILRKLNIDLKNLNIVMLGYSYECKLIPLKCESLEKSIRNQLGEKAVIYFKIGRILKENYNYFRNCMQNCLDFVFENNKLNTEREMEDILLEFGGKKYYNKFRNFCNFVDLNTEGRKEIGHILKVLYFNNLYSRDRFEVSRLWLNYLEKNKIEKGKIYLSPPGLRMLKKKIGFSVRLAKILFKVLYKLRFIRNVHFLNPFNIYKYRRYNNKFRKTTNNILELLIFNNKIRLCDSEYIKNISRIVLSVRGYGYVRYRFIMYFLPKLKNIEKDLLKK